MKTAVTEYLESQGVSYTVKQHKNPALTSETAATERGVRLSQIVKCMIGETETNALVVMLLPGDRTLKSSKARKWLRASSLSLVSPQQLAQDHNLVVGAISPIQLLG